MLVTLRAFPEPTDSYNVWLSCLIIKQSETLASAQASIGSIIVGDGSSVADLRLLGSEYHNCCFIFNDSGLSAGLGMEIS